MISIFENSRELRFAAISMNRASKELKKTFNTNLKQFDAIYRQELNKLVKTNTDKAIVKNAKLSRGTRVAFSAATSRKVLSGGLSIPQKWAIFEFGTLNRNKYSTYRLKNKQIKRRTRRGLPAREPKGRILYPTSYKLAARAASLYSQIAIKMWLENWKN